MDNPEQRAQVLIEALPYIQEFHGEDIVIKFGGSVMKDDELKKSVAQDIVLLQYVGFEPIVVHGGGPVIAETLRKMGIDSQFVEGLRVTDPETMDVVEMVLAGRVNKDVVNLINMAGANAIGLSGKDGQLLQAEPHSSAEELDIDIGQVGEITSVNPEPIQLLQEKGYVPVIAPIGVDASGTTFNLNADEVAGAVARSLSVRKLIYLTDVEGILEDDELISTLSTREIEAKRESGIIQGGMVPKATSAREAVEHGVQKAHIINGNREHSLLLELLTREGIGTQILPSTEDNPDVRMV
ncbi:MAG: acetylglutamate kinase [bacterium]